MQKTIIKAKSSTKKQPSTTYGVVSMVMGILSLCLFLMPYFGLPLAILALVFAHKQSKHMPTGMASAGNVMGIIGIVINAVTLLIIGIVLIAASAIV